MKNLIVVKDKTHLLEYLLKGLHLLIVNGEKIFVSLKTSDGIVFGLVKSIKNSFVSVETTYQFIKDKGWQVNERYHWEPAEENTIKFHFRHSDLYSEIISREWEFSDKGNDEKYRGCMIGDDYPLKIPSSSNSIVY